PNWSALSTQEAPAEPISPVSASTATIEKVSWLWAAINEKSKPAVNIVFRLIFMVNLIYNFQQSFLKGIFRPLDPFIGYLPDRTAILQAIEHGQPIRGASRKRENFISSHFQDWIERIDLDRAGFHAGVASGAGMQFFRSDVIEKRFSIVVIC